METDTTGNSRRRRRGLDWRSEADGCRAAIAVTCLDARPARYYERRSNIIDHVMWVTDRQIDRRTHRHTAAEKEIGGTG